MIDANNKAVRDLGSLPPEPGDVIAGKYRVESLVGTGGMGVVVAARHLQLGQRVAIKLLRLSGLDPDRQVEARARFLREGQAAAALSSDHVVRIHDVGTLDSGEPFMVMELLRGDDLGQLIDRQGPAPVSAAVDYVLQACHAVAEAHASGIVHRDLKPSNLFVSMRSDGRATIKVLDFGISKTKSPIDDAFDGNLTDTRSVVGSPYYMSPEQVRDAKRVDVRTDVWSLGMILYELLTGEPAFNGETLPAICAAIAADTPRPLRAVRPEVPEPLELIVQKCLAKNPDDRYQTVDELVRALSPLAPGSGIESATYASSRDVTALSEPFDVGARNKETLHQRTEPSAPARSAGGSPEVVNGSAATKLEPPAPTVGSGSRRREDFAHSPTLVSSSSDKASPPPSVESTAERPADARPEGVRWLIVVVLLAAAVAFALIAFWPKKTPEPRAPSVEPRATSVEPRPPNAAPVVESAPKAPPAVLAAPSNETAPPPASAAPSVAPPSRGRPRAPHKAPRTPATAPPVPSDIRLER